MELEENGKLVFGTGNTCNHLFTLPFLSQICRDFTLPFALLERKYPIVILDINGIKLEMFIFDIFPLCNSLCVDTFKEMILAIVIIFI